MRQQEAGGTAKTRGEGDVAARHTQKRQLEEQAAASSPTPRASWQDITIATFVPLNLIGINRLAALEHSIRTRGVLMYGSDWLDVM